MRPGNPRPPRTRDRAVACGSRGTPQHPPPAPPSPAPTAGFGTVKAVLSGDTVLLLGKATTPGAPPPELQLSLSHLAAPRLSRHPDTRDEPWAWASREFLRKLLIGKVVRFRVDYRVERIARNFGTLWLQEGGEPAAAAAAAAAASVNAQVVAAGWARLAPSADAAKAASGGVLVDEFGSLAAAAAAAAAAGAGLHNAAPGEADASVRAIKWSVPPADAPVIAAQLALAAEGLPAIVEQVVNGGLLRVLVPAAAGGGNAFLALTVSLAGVQCPKAPSAPVPAPAPPAAAAGAAATTASRLAAAAAGAGGGAKPADAAASSDGALGAEAKLFTELRLLGRDVTLHVTGADKPPAGAAGAAANATFFARVEHPSGDIAVELLRAGLARMVDYSLPPAGGPAGPSIGAMRAAERSAKAAQLRLWAGYVQRALPAALAGAREYDGRVAEVVSGDTLVVQVATPGGGFEDRRVSFASVRAPRLAPRGGAAGGAGAKDAPWAHEAREHIRKALIGRDVHVCVDYVKAPAPPAGAAGGDAAGGGGGGGGGADRVFATVTWSTKKGDAHNVAAGLVAEGLAEVTRHRAGDEDRSSGYDALLAAEDAAKAAKKGVHSGKEAPSHARIVDVSGDAAKAKGHVGFLQRARTVRGLVEHVIPGGRMRVVIPSENVQILFGLAGVRCPATARAGGGAAAARAGEPCGEEAFRWLREAVNQQEVELEVEEADRNGAMLGAMWTGKGGARKSVAGELLRRGLAYGVQPVITRVRYADELVAAEAEARGVKRGVWAHYVEPVEDAGEEGAGGGDEGEALAAALAAASVKGGAAASGGFPALGGAPAAAAAAAPAAAASSSGGGLVKGTVCEVIDGLHLWVQAEADRPKLASVTAKMEELSAEHVRCAAALPGRGDGGGWRRVAVAIARHRHLTAVRPLEVQRALRQFILPARKLPPPPHAGHPIGASGHQEGAHGCGAAQGPRRAQVAPRAHRGAGA